MIASGFVRARWWAAFLAVLMAPPLAAQSLTAGALAGAVIDEAGSPVANVTVTLERAGVAFHTLTTDGGGRFTLPLLASGRYAVLAEQIGFQPVRATGVLVAAGRETRVTVRIVRRPPPIAAVEERPASATFAGGAGGRVFGGRELDRFDRHRDVTDLTRGATEVNAPVDRAGFATSASGLDPAFSRLLVDGVEEALLSHPGIPGTPATAPLFARDGVDQAMVTGFGADLEWRSAPGAILSAQSARGGSRPFLRPFATFSSSTLGGAALDNPADSSGSSFHVGAALGGPIKGDTASWFLRFDYQKLQQPSADPFVLEPVPQDATDPVAAIGSGAGRDVSSWLAPVVRSRQGFGGAGRIDWRFGRTSALALRLGVASFDEDNPLIGTTLSNNAGTRLEGSDLSAYAALTSAGSWWTNEARMGLRTAKRDWLASDLPFTSFANDAIAIGTDPALVGAFEERAFELNDALSVRVGTHQIKIGGLVQRRTVTYDQLFGSAGRFDFGVAESFGSRLGVFSQAVRSVAAEALGISQVAGFIQDTWQVTPDIQLLAGVRIEKEVLPTDAVQPNAGWAALTAINTGLLPVADPVIAPRGAFVWNVGGSGQTTLRGAAGIVPGRTDLAALAEVASHDGGVTIRRAADMVEWPTPPTGLVTKPTLSLYGPDVRLPRAFKAEGALEQQVAAGVTLTVGGGYRHTDYQLQRTDINLSPAPVSTAVDGRAVYGSLRNYGGIVASAIGSNRRFDEFDAVFGLTSTGYTDYYEAAVSLERRATRGLTLLAAYTYSKTTDNLPGQLSADPADRMSPFPAGINGESWDDARSDLDVPHRLVATIEYAHGGRTPLTVAARFRYRSGLPFTPGFRTGVDVNGDGGANNDPAAISGSVPGLSELLARHSCLTAGAGGFAARNSCREDAAHALDLHLSVGLPVGGARRVALAVDAFNVVGSAIGIIDRAVFLVDPAGAITIDGAGRTVLPLVVNSRFGTILSRRNDARMLRIGLRMET